MSENSASEPGMVTVVSFPPSQIAAWVGCPPVYTRPTMKRPDGSAPVTRPSWPALGTGSSDSTQLSEVGPAGVDGDAAVDALAVPVFGDAATPTPAGSFCCTAWIAAGAAATTATTARTLPPVVAKRRRC